MSTHKTEVPYGTLDLVILKTLDTMGAMHGYSIAQAHRAGGRQPAANEPGIDLSGAHSARATRLDPDPVGHLGNEPEGQVLFADGRRHAPAARRSGELGAGDGAGRQIPRGEVMTPAAARSPPARARPHATPRDGAGRRSPGAPGDGREGRDRRRPVAGGRAPCRPPPLRQHRRMKEEHRDRRSVRWMDTLVKDFRYGLLLLRRDPGFAFVAISVMAIGIGANTAMFSLMDARAAEAAAISRAGTDCPRVGGADSDIAQRDQHAQLHRLEAAEHVVRGALGRARAERRADRAGGARTTGGHAGVGRLLRCLRREGRARPHVSARTKISRVRAGSSC